MRVCYNILGPIITFAMMVLHAHFPGNVFIQLAVNMFLMHYKNGLTLNVYNAYLCRSFYQTYIATYTLCEMSRKNAQSISCRPYRCIIFSQYEKAIR